MSPSQLKIGYSVLAGVNTFATTLFLYYLFFALRDRFGFGNRENLWISAMHGFIYTFAAWQCGRFAQRKGNLNSLKVGFGGLMLLMVAGAILDSVPGIICVLIAYSAVLLFTWPALEALVSENETRAGVQHNVGVYNCTWAAAAALAYFSGGPLYDWLGRAAVFWVPSAIFLGQFLYVLWVERTYGHAQATALPPPDVPPAVDPAARRQSVSPHGFLKMAWLANPFAYVAVNTLLAVMPELARRLGLSPTQVGLFCSVWFFARFVAFVVLWKWAGWHYRFRWLLTAYLMLVGGFTGVVLAPTLWVLVVAQLFFGVAAGLIYYSSLFYSMDVGETKGEHGGLHEAAIGTGIFVGPAAGAASLQFLPQVAHAGVIAVSLLLLAGLGGLLFIRRQESRR